MTYIFLAGAVFATLLAVYDTLTLLRVALGKATWRSRWNLWTTALSVSLYTAAAVAWFSLVIR